MGIAIDIFIVVFLALSVYLGYKKGFVTLAIKLCAFLIAILITFVLYRPLGNLVINTTSVDESIEDSIYNKVTETMQKDESGELTNDLIESAKQGMLEQSARELAINIVYAGTAVILFVIVRIILIFVNALANLIAKLPIIKQANEAGGAIYGLLRGIVIIYAVLMILYFVNEFYPQNIVTQSINQTTVTKIMYENNLFNIFLN